MAIKNKHPKKKKEQEERLFLTIAIVVALAILLIITLGIFFRREKVKKYEEEKEKKRQRLVEVDARIKILEAERDEIEKRERRILIYARSGIAVLLVTSNILYQYFVLPPFKIPDSFGDILNFNGAILMLYAFVGYITYGTISNLVSALKAKLANILRKNHLGSLEELESLENERDLLKSELEELDKNLTQLQKSNFSF